MPKMTIGKYELTATRIERVVLRQCFDDLDDAHQTLADALMRYPDCEIRLTNGRRVLLTAAPISER